MMLHGMYKHRPIVAESPRTLAEEIENRVIGSALDQECRAQKALFMLKARDRRIAFLERRVSELEDAAGSLHAMSLRTSSTLSSLDLQDKEIFFSVSRSENSGKLNSRNNQPMKSASSNIRKDIYEEYDMRYESQPEVPNLKLSTPSASSLNKEIFMTPMISHIYNECNNKINKSYPNFNYNIKMQDYELQSTDRGNFMTSNPFLKYELNEESSITICREKIESGPSTDNKLSESDSIWNEHRPIDLIKEAGLKRSKRQFVRKTMSIDHGTVTNASIDDGTKKVYVILQAKQRKSIKTSKTSFSKTRMRTRRNIRRKTRINNSKHAKTQGEEDERYSINTLPRTTESISSRHEDEQGLASRSEWPERNSNAKPTKDIEDMEKQEARVIAVQTSVMETKTSSTQTITMCDKDETNLLEGVQTTNHHHAASCSFEEEKSLTEEVSAGQLLTEEVLRRGNEVCSEDGWQQEMEIYKRKEIEYESIISALEEKLDDVKAELEETLKKKCVTKEKYKNALEKVKEEARKENEMLQEKIIQICKSVFEKFGPYALSEDQEKIDKEKGHKLIKNRGRVSCKLHRKLRTAAATTGKLKRELALTRKALKSKSEKYESVNKCFTRLKQEMETTEMDLNNLMSENVSLRKKINDTKELVELKIGKEQPEKNNLAQFRDMQRSRELTSLKKRAEENFATITELRSKLLKSESANANKHYLLNSYKSQLTDFTKEKDQLTVKIKGLENEVNALRTTNSELEAQISLLSNEKENSTTSIVEEKLDDVKLKDTEEIMCEEKETQTESNEDYNCEEYMQRELDAVKAKYEELIKTIKAKLNLAENHNNQYQTAIKAFLKRIHEYREERETEKSLSGSETSEKESRGTICSILNMTPTQISDYLTPSNTIHTCLTDLNKIISRTNFADNLAKLLFKSTLKIIKV